jgi:hypothetical protein
MPTCAGNHNCELVFCCSVPFRLGGAAIPNWTLELGVNQLAQGVRPQTGTVGQQGRHKVQLA